MRVVQLEVDSTHYEAQDDGRADLCHQSVRVTDHVLERPAAHNMQL